MNFLIGVIALCSGSWMTIYLYGLYATSSVKYHDVLIIFPVIMVLVVLYCAYLEINKMEKKQ
ncbi:hypothetical protein QE429_000893 [Bacillus sp. SORGH_AS 510]|uniref:hypothetical protein n=1 Tax=Bacillus sp. SORGH_AS_0510 TaxID=3041771 RepID=UPI00278B401B|nr:hypothetical protein [Bacillus sp. SORGH_AS_0510]MDQ1144066.1 hypothetical protein [Bacillus sp. SORGH_AS_0510]